MRIQTRFRLAIWVSSAIMAFAVLFAVGASYYTDRILNDYLSLERLADNVVGLRTATIEYASAPSERLEQQWRQLHGAIKKELAYAPGLPADIAEACERLGKLFDTLGERAPAATDLHDRLLFSALSETQRVVDWVRASADEARTRFHNALRGYGIVMLSLLLPIAAVIWVIVLSSGRRIVRSVVTLKEGARMLSQGALDHRIRLSGEDEFAELADTFNGMTAELRALYERMSQTNRSLRTLSRCNDILVRSSDETALLKGVVSLLVVEGRHHLALVGLCGNDGELQILHHAGRGSWRDDTPKYGHEPLALALSLREPVVIQDISELDDDVAWRDSAVADGFLSVIALPLISQNTVSGALGIWSGSNSVFSDNEVALLTELAGDLSYGLSALRVRAERALAQSRLAQLAAAVEQSGEDIVIMDGEGIIRYVNPAFQSTTGFTEAECVGRDALMLESGKTDAGLLRDLWDTTRAGALWRGRLVNRTKDGREIIQETSASAIRDGSGLCVGFAWALRDISRQLQTEQHMAQSQRLQSIGTLAGGIAHDFNNILSSITGYTELALAKAVDSEQREDLDSILTAAKRAAELIAQILAFSRMKEQDAKPIRVAPLVKEVLKLLRASLPTSIEMESHIVSHAAVLADPSEIHRVIVNLCTNAAAAMNENGGVLTVSLTDASVTSDRPLDGHWELPPGPYALLTVRDTGCGIPQELTERVFEPFFTTRKDLGGTGMGLSVVHGIIASRKGSVSVKSVVGRGTTFEIALPTTEGVSDEAPSSRSADGRPITGTECLLVVDDETTVARLIKRLLEKAGYTVDAFTESPEALEAFAKTPQRYDMVITDMTMPHMTGDVLIQRLRAIRPDLPVILCSGYSERINPEAAAALGVDEFATKPLSGAKLTRLIRKVLDSSPAPGPEQKAAPDTDSASAGHDAGPRPDRSTNPQDERTPHERG